MNNTKDLKEKIEKWERENNKFLADKTKEFILSLFEAEKKEYIGQNKRIAYQQGYEDGHEVGMKAKRYYQKLYLEAKEKEKWRIKKAILLIDDLDEAKKIIREELQGKTKDSGEGVK